jgi:hypothetical protein
MYGERTQFADASSADSDVWQDGHLQNSDEGIVPIERGLRPFEAAPLRPRSSTLQMAQPPPLGPLARPASVSRRPSSASVVPESRTLLRAPAGLRGRELSSAALARVLSSSEIGPRGPQPPPPQVQVQAPAGSGGRRPLSMSQLGRPPGESRAPPPQRPPSSRLTEAPLGLARSGSRAGPPTRAPRLSGSLAVPERDLGADDGSEVVPWRGRDSWDVGGRSRH